VPAAWRITAGSHFDQIIPELVCSPPAKADYQRHLLHDALRCDSPAAPRLVELIGRMSELAKRAAAAGEPMHFPARLLESPGDSPAAVPIPIDFARLFPEQQWAEKATLLGLQLEVADMRQALAAANHAIAHLRDTLAWREHQLAEKGLKRKAERLKNKIRRAAGRLVRRDCDRPSDPPSRLAA
jgi:hypothetical protein